MIGNEERKKEIIDVARKALEEKKPESGNESSVTFGAIKDHLMSKIDVTKEQGD